MLANNRARRYETKTFLGGKTGPCPTQPAHQKKTNSGLTAGDQFERSATAFNPRTRIALADCLRAAGSGVLSYQCVCCSCKTFGFT
jgi:hypothetical protein